MPRLTKLHHLLAELGSPGEDEQHTTLLELPGVRVLRIVSHGHASPPAFWYEQDEHEYVTLLSGAARLELDGGELLDMKAGDAVWLPARLRHRVDWTTPDEPTVWLALFCAAAEGVDGSMARLLEHLSG